MLASKFSGSHHWEKSNGNGLTWIYLLWTTKGWCKCKSYVQKDKRWKNLSVESGYKDDPLCTLKDAFVKVKRSQGFNIELKFDDNIVYGEEELCQTLENILKVKN